MVDLKAASDLVKSDAIVAVRTPIGYLMMCNAQTESAVGSLKSTCNIKGSDGLNLWMDNESRLNRHLREVPEVAWDLIDSTEGEITLILPEGHQIAKSAMFEDGYIAVTITDFDWAKRFIQQAKSPIAVVNWMSAELPSNLEIQVLDLSPEKTIRETPQFSVIKIAGDGGIKILRRQGNKILPHL